MLGNLEDLDDQARRARELYDSVIKSRVEPNHVSELVVINLDTGEYVMDQDYVAAVIRASEMFPDAQRFSLRVGYKTAYSFGARVARAF